MVRNGEYTENGKNNSFNDLESKLSNFNEMNAYSNFISNTIIWSI